MKNLIEIKIECKGSAVGTLGWFNSFMKDSELVIKNNKEGRPAMFLKYTNEKETGYKWICEIWDKNDDPFQGRLLHNQLILCTYSYKTYPYYSLFHHPLTPACQVKVVEFIEDAVEKYLEWWENDGKKDN